MRSIVGALLGVFALGLNCSNSQAEDQLSIKDCGKIHVRITSVALADNGAPPHQQTMDQLWEIPKGPKQYGDKGAIVTQGYPHNGGSHSWEYLTTDCAIGQGRPALKVTADSWSDINSGVGKGTGASSDYDKEISIEIKAISADTPPTLLITSDIQAANVGPSCSARLNDGPPAEIKTGHTVLNLGKVTKDSTVTIACSQGHVAIFPKGPQPTATVAKISSSFELDLSPP